LIEEFVLVTMLVILTVSEEEHEGM